MSSPAGLPETSASERQTGDARYRAMRRVTLAGAGVNLLLSATQLFVGILAQSQALVADGAHTASDLASDVLVWFAAKHASREADEDHPYGHGRIETVATVGLGLALLGVAGGIAVDAVQRLFEPTRLLSPEPLALAAAGLAVVAKESLYHYSMYVARRVRSNMLRANAWHHRSDVVSSLIVVAGIAGTLAGLPYLDAVAAVGVAVLIAHMGGKLIWQAIRELIDTALEQERVDTIRRSIAQVDGVKSLHMLRTRRMGGEALADVHIQVNPWISVSEGHQISDAVRRRVIEGFDEISDVTVHIDPENDIDHAPCQHLPLRTQLLQELREHWSTIPAAEQLQSVRLHYLSGKVHLELCLPLDAMGSLEAAREVAQQLLEASQRHPHVGGVVVYFR